MVTISMPPPYLFPFSVPCTVMLQCTGDQTIHRIFRPFPILYLAASSTHLEMGRTGPLWKTSPPSSPRWTPASPSTKRPPYPSSRAQSEFLEPSKPYGLLIVCFMWKWKASQSSSPIHMVTLCSLRLRPDQREQLVSMVHKTVLIFCISRV